ncbi:MAG: DUF6677 family protein [Haloarculaceae archaeon]
MARTGYKRPWLAAALALVYPGLGHLYLREWIRSLLWFGLIVTTSGMLIPPGTLPQTASLQSISEVYAQMPLETELALTLVTVLSGVDAYWTASRNNERRRRERTGTRCPECGREVDADLAFCHWCTAELDRPAEADADSPDA